MYYVILKLANSGKFLFFILYSLTMSLFQEIAAVQNENNRLKRENAKLKKQIETENQEIEINESMEDQLNKYEKIFNNIRDILQRDQDDLMFLDDEEDDSSITSLTAEDKLDMIDRALKEEEIDDEDYEDTASETSSNSSTTELVEDELDLEITLKTDTERMVEDLVLDIIDLAMISKSKKRKQKCKLEKNQKKIKVEDDLLSDCSTLV